MGQYHNSNAVLDGLVLYIDPKDPVCFTPGETTIKNLVGTTPDGYVSAGTVYNQEGTFFFDGTDDTLNFSPNEVFEVGVEPITIEAWFKLLGVGTNNIAAICVMGNPLCDGCTGGFGLFVFGDSSLNGRFDETGLQSMDSLSHNQGSLIDDTFHQVVLLRNGAEVKLYFDGQLVNSITDHRWNISYNNNLTLSGWSAYRGPMENGPLRIYNRELSDIEVLKNYNSTKSRYNA